MQSAATRIALVTAGLLLVPLVAMQLTNEVDWQPGDFVVGGALLVAAGGVHELLKPKARTVAQRAVLGASVAAAVLLVWGSLAVGS